MYKIIDTHIHLYSEEIDKDIDNYLDDNFSNDVIELFNTADSYESFEKILSLSSKYPGKVHSILGIHPEYANYGEEYLEKSIEFIRANKDKIVAVGEIGLDYHFDKSEENKINQKHYFIKQIELAKELGLPIVVHSRDASLDTYEIIAEHCKGMKVDLHCYSSSKEVAENYLRLKDVEVYFGVGGVLTFKNNVVTKEVVEHIPLERILTETDAPYLTPVPFRGKLNNPKYIKYVLEKIAEIKKMSVFEVNEIINNNVRRFFNVGK